MLENTTVDAELLGVGVRDKYQECLCSKHTGSFQYVPCLSKIALADNF